MRKGLRGHLTYSNVMATAAMFVALGGGAYALSTNSVESKHIVNDEVKSADLANDGVKAKDVDASTFTWKDLPVGGVAPAQIRDVGGNGDTLFGGIAGRTIADSDVEQVYMGVPAGTVADSLTVAIEDPVAPGETREFALVAYPNLVGGAGAESVLLECTLQNPGAGGGGPESCADSSPSAVLNGVYAIRVESTGAGLDPLDDAYVGVSLKAPFDFESP